MATLDKNMLHEISFTGKLLVALPSLHASCFAKAVIYICNHDASGAMGLIVNNSINELDYPAVLKQFNIPIITELDSRSKMPIHFGGPVDMVKGFVLHTPDYSSGDTFNVGENVSLTSNIQILRDITTGTGPRKRMLALGYAGWGPGQLETEIKQGSWFTVPSSEELIFDENNSNKWKQAASLAGIRDPFMFSREVGHA